MGMQNILGKKGEELAAEWLTEKGYTILERNFRFGKAEIDILARKKEILAVVEVKLRRFDHLDTMNIAVGKQKRERIIRAADHYISKMDVDAEVRFDIILILHEGDRFRTEHLEAAFSAY
jgi:putative endonuclease